MDGKDEAASGSFAERIEKVLSKEFEAGKPVDFVKNEEHRKAQKGSWHLKSGL